MIGRAAKFRQLVEKYLECIRNEEGIYKTSSQKEEES